MPVKLRLARHGRKRFAYYHIVVADGRAPRDGKFIERIGTYNPNSNPAEIKLDFDKALSWLQKGAQPTETVRAILSYKGVLLKRHLLEGVKKGAFDEAAAEAKFQAWLKEKENKIQAKVDKLSEKAKAEQEKKIEAEKKVNEERAQAIAKKNSELAEEAKEEVKDEDTATEEVTEENNADNSAKEEEKPEAKQEEEKEENKTEEKTDATEEKDKTE